MEILGRSNDTGYPSAFKSQFLKLKFSLVLKAIVRCGH